MISKPSAPIEIAKGRVNPYGVGRSVVFHYQGQAIRSGYLHARCKGAARRVHNLQAIVGEDALRAGQDQSGAIGRGLCRGSSYSEFDAQRTRTNRAGTHHKILPHAIDSDGILFNQAGTDEGDHLLAHRNSSRPVNGQKGPIATQRTG